MADPSIRDVAQLAKVSTATVSRVLNQNANVKPHLRERVLAAMDALDYEPSGIARNMRSQSNKNIALLIADIQNPYFSTVMHSIEESAFEQQYMVLLGSSDGAPSREREYLELFARERSAGAIVFPVATDPRAYAMRRPMPIVFFDRGVPGVEFDAVVLDHESGGRRGTEHLLNLGHSRIGIIATHPEYPGLKHREEGYRNAMYAAGIQPDTLLTSWGDEVREAGGYRAAMQLLSLTPRPTALLAVNNVRTLGMLRAVSEHGLRVPDDISLVGFDDSPWYALMSPPLTALRQPTHAIGKEAVRLLMNRIRGGSDRPAEVTVMQLELIERGSTRAL